MKKHIPNFITSLNLVSGCIGIISTLEGNLTIGALMIAIAAFFDFFDGLSARILNVKSEIGKQLDSLADVVSFGVLPGLILFGLMKQSSALPQLGLFQNEMAYLSLIVPVFSALRLAKFNIDTRQTTSFLGVPTPANAILLGSLPLIVANSSGSGVSNFLIVAIGNYYVLLFLVIIMSLLLVSEIPLFALKFSSLRVSDNKPQYILICVSIILFGLFFVASIPMIILLYILLSLFFKK